MLLSFPNYFSFWMKCTTLVFLGETIFSDVIKLHIKFSFKPLSISKLHLNPVKSLPFTVVF